MLTVVLRLDVRAILTGQDVMVMAQTALRWRITVTFFGYPELTRKYWYSHKCKLCAARRAAKMAEAVTKTVPSKYGVARWDLAVTKGHLTEPTIVMTSESPTGRIVVKHAH